MERIGGELGRVTALRRKPPERGGDLRGADSRHLQHAQALGRLGERRPSRHGGRTSLGVEARDDHAAALRGKRNAHQVSAGRAARRAAERARRRGPAARAVTQVVLDRLEAHLVPRA